MAANDPTSSPYDEFNERMRRCGAWVRALWAGQPGGTWLQILMFIVLAAYSAFTYRLLKTSELTLRTLTQQLEATDRPWVAIDLQLAELPRVETDTLTMPVVMNIRNQGRAVATNIHLWSFGDVFTGGFRDHPLKEPVVRQSVDCNAARERPIIPDPRCGPNHRSASSHSGDWQRKWGIRH
jgi:hypothetical protein